MNKNKLRTGIKIGSLGLLLFFSTICSAQETTSEQTELTNSQNSSSNIISRISVDIRPSYIFPTNDFLKGHNQSGEHLNNSSSGHLRYSFQFKPNTSVDQIYNSPYQGIGLARYSFKNREEIGSPVALYVFQGARIARLHPKLSLNYEWNFGLSFGWEPYGEDNGFNVIIGSKTNAYLHTNLYLNWMLNNQVDLTAGVGLSHFSNGNTNFPNAGLNTLDFRIGLVYNINREEKTLTRPLYCHPIPEFKRHISYDLVLFGSWRRKGIITEDSQVALDDKFTVLGFNFNPMYNMGYKFRVGASLDGVYDESANIRHNNEEYYSGASDKEYIKPSLSAQLALGVSGRVEYVMPYFTVGVGVGVNALHRGGDFKAIYQILALKAEITRNSFLHIGYSLNDFHNPNYLMLGIGYRFNNKAPCTHRKR
ncbi:acyloxyacyl hydrolase [Bacteroides sp. 51]|uniref:acyloxyacyl hydrolase n=1 Tax=Bacteroides sp. 51 TaxID=2302938 RepID=UPI0013D49CE8|nr:acyloxyacyl hydrolase [Bacteroides sp. 51]NDV82520.1 acyloxyacyl hydrolase [Bacteroides sp. 51]